MTKIAIVKFEKYDGKMSRTWMTLYFRSRAQAEQHLQGKGYKRTESILRSREEQWDLDYATSAQVCEVELTNFDTYINGARQ